MYSAIPFYGTSGRSAFPTEHFDTLLQRTGENMKHAAPRPSEKLAYHSSTPPNHSEKLQTPATPQSKMEHRNLRDSASNQAMPFYRFAPHREGRWPRDHLKDFKLGSMHGYPYFEEFYRGGRITDETINCPASTLLTIDRQNIKIHDS